MTHRTRTLLVAGAVLATTAGARAYGQTADPGTFDQATAKPTAPSAVAPRAAKAPGRAGSFEISASFVIHGPASLGSREATLTPNDANATTGYTLFAASGRLQTAPGFDVRLGYAVTRAVVIEGGMSYGRPGVSLTVSRDVEDAPAFTATAEHLSQYAFDAGLRVHLRSLEFRRGRGRPFAAAGVAYLRELHEGQTVVDTGTVYNFGGGVIYLFRVRRMTLLGGLAMQGLGIRADARLNLTTGGFSFDGSSRVSAVTGAGLFIGF